MAWPLNLHNPKIEQWPAVIGLKVLIFSQDIF
jgi:hypothetical protein